MRSKRLIPATLTLLFLLLPKQGVAQQRVVEPTHHQHVISGSPLLLLAGWFNAEYERKVGEDLTLGIAGGWVDLDKEDYTSVTGFVRFYPRTPAFMGFYVGGRAGVYRVDDRRKTHTALGFGAEVGYAWLLGPGRSFYLGLGLGVNRLFPGDLGRASAVVPSVRLLDIGVAF